MRCMQSNDAGRAWHAVVHFYAVLLMLVLLLLWWRLLLVMPFSFLQFAADAAAIAIAAPLICTPPYPLHV